VTDPQLRLAPPGSALPGPAARRHPTRRALIAGGLAITGGAALGPRLTRPADTPAAAALPAQADVAVGAARLPFYGPHQCGVETDPQAHATFLALDLAPGTDRAALTRMMRLVTDDAARLTQGHPALADIAPHLAATPARLSVTVGFGPAVFDRDGLAARRPPSVAALPAFGGPDRLQDRWSGGDVLLHVAADDPATVSHAVRMLTTDTRRFATIRWVQRGFRPAAGTLPAGQTLRNLMDQIDGTVNPRPGSPDFADVVWARGNPGWFAGGTVLVLRRIRMILEAWDAFDPGGKELVMGRRLGNGAPLTGHTEHDAPDLNAVDTLGLPVIDQNAHIRLAHATTPAERMLRRGYNYDDGPLPDATADSGLLFAAYQGDADTAFVPVQRRLAAADNLNRWITHIGSAVFAIPPGAPGPGHYLGESLLSS